MFSDDCFWIGPSALVSLFRVSGHIVHIQLFGLISDGQTN